MTQTLMHFVFNLFHDTNGLSFDSECSFPNRKFLSSSSKFTHVLLKCCASTINYINCFTCCLYLVGKKQLQQKVPKPYCIMLVLFCKSFWPFLDASGENMANVIRQQNYIALQAEHRSGVK